MRKEVEDFLAQREQEKREAQRDERAARLLELGLYRTEEVDEDAPGPVEFHDGKRVRFLPLELTEEEYAAVCAAAPQEKAAGPGLPVHKILFVLAILVYAYGVVFLGYGWSTFGGTFLSAVGGVVNIAISGSSLLAMSEIVRLLKKRCGEL